MQVMTVNTKKREEFVDIAAGIEKILRAAGIERGLCFLFCPHTTAALTINENADAAVVQDMLKHLRAMVPRAADFTHGEGNSDAHIKSSLLGSSLQIIIEDGRLCLGTWQGVYFCEFDGPRKRRVYVKIMEG